MVNLRVGNIYSKASGAKQKEIFRVLASNSYLRIERIVSCGQKTPENTWLSEKYDEWVLVLKGAGKLSFKIKSRTVSLKEGDYVFIPANTPHRVEWTPPRRKTIWLAVCAKA